MKFELYKDRKGLWRWRLKTRNGNTIADSAEAYKRRRDAVRGIDICMETCSATPVIDLAEGC